MPSTVPGLKSPRSAKTGAAGHCSPKWGICFALLEEDSDPSAGQRSTTEINSQTTAATNDINLSLSQNDLKFLKILSLPCDYSKLSFKGAMDKPLYIAILKTLALRSDRTTYIHLRSTLSCRQQLGIVDFMSRNQCNFSHRGNRNKPIYSLKEDILGNLVLSKYDGMPVIMHHKYKKAGGMLLQSKRLSMLKSWIPYLQTSIAQNFLMEKKSCAPGGINATSKIFHSRFYFKGIFKRIRSLLPACKMCRLNTALPMMQATPPQPIRSFAPHERIQYNLIDMAPNKKGHS